MKKTSLEAFSAPRKRGVYAINIDDGDQLIAARVCTAGDQVMLFTRLGMAVRFDESLVRPVGRVARGVRGATLRGAEDAIVSCEVVRPDQSVLVVCENGYGKRSHVEDFRQTNRGGVGVRSIITSERNGGVVGAISVKDNEGVLLMASSGQTLRIAMTDVRVMGRSTQGVRLVNIPNSDTVVAVQKIEQAAEEKNEVKA